MCELRRGRRLSNLSAAAKPKVMLKVWWSLYLGEGLAQWSRSGATAKSSGQDQEQRPSVAVTIKSNCRDQEHSGAEASAESSCQDQEQSSERSRSNRQV